MFSRTERAYLRLLTEGPGTATGPRVEAQFPNPAYRRKLLWGIRRKASHSLEDWQLYAEAARREPRILPLGPGHAAEPHPIFVDPLVTMLESLRRAWAPRSRKTRSVEPATGAPRK
jgi:hypothetical protein